jgi:hypothetical protein
VKLHLDYHLREAPAVLTAAVAVGLFGLLFWSMTPSPSAPVERVSGEILTFRPLEEPHPANPQAWVTVRLDSGLQVMLTLPRSARAMDCRAGDRVELLRRGHRLFFPVAGCGPISPPPARAPA